MKLLTICSSGQSVLDQSCFGLKDFQTEVGIGPKYHWGRSIPWAELCLGPKYVWSQKLWLSNLKNKVGKTVQNVHCAICVCTVRTLFVKVYEGLRNSNSIPHIKNQLSSLKNKKNGKTVQNGHCAVVVGQIC